MRLRWISLFSYWMRYDQLISDNWWMPMGLWDWAGREWGGGNSNRRQGHWGAFSKDVYRVLQSSSSKLKFPNFYFNHFRKAVKILWGSICIITYQSSDVDFFTVHNTTQRNHTIRFRIHVPSLHYTCECDGVMWCKVKKDVITVLLSKFQFAYIFPFSVRFSFDSSWIVTVHRCRNIYIMATQISGE